MREEDLEEVGVSALGARRKLCRVFEWVKMELDRQGVRY